ncbi:unnamed protein product [Phaeothamnion confervicola]
MAVASLAALGRGVYFTRAYQTALLVIYNVSYSTALYCLVLYYLAIKPLLAAHKPVQKFLAVKSIVFFTFWQSVLVTLLPGVSTEQALLWNDFILCVEMVPFGLLLNHAFPYTEFVVNANDKQVLNSVRQMLSVKDVLEDLQYSFKPVYQNYVVARDDHDAPPKTVLTRTFLVGNIDSPLRKQPPRDFEVEKRADGAAHNRGGGSDNDNGEREGSGNGGGADWADVQMLDEDWSADVTVLEVEQMRRAEAAAARGGGAAVRGRRDGGGGGGGERRGRGAGEPLGESLEAPPIRQRALV